MVYVFYLFFNKYHYLFCGFILYCAYPLFGEFIFTVKERCRYIFCNGIWG